MTPIAETERLYLREITPAEAEHAYPLNLNPEVIRYTGDRPFENVESAARFLRASDINFDGEAGSLYRMDRSDFYYCS